jgi:hypothetical protein
MSVFRHDLWVTDFSGPRFDLALDLLESGEGFVVSGIKMCLERDELQMYVPSSWSINSVTEGRAREDLSRADELVAALSDASQRFCKLTLGKSRKQVLISDYETGWLPICTSLDGIFSWEEY